MKQYTILLLLLLAGSVQGHNARYVCLTKGQPVTIAKAEWLLGEWEQPRSNRMQYEIWRQQDDSTYAGKSFFLNGKDTVILEQIRLEQRKGNLFYIPTASGENNEQPVVFTLTAATGRRLVFDNPAHDFPQKITYTQLAADSLLAEISGTINSAYKMVPFPMKIKKSNYTPSR